MRVLVTTHYLDRLAAHRTVTLKDGHSLTIVNHGETRPILKLTLRGKTTIELEVFPNKRSYET